MNGTRIASAVAATLLLAGCAGFVTDNPMQGIEVYRPAYCLVVTAENASVFTCPNLTSSYEIKPRSFLAKNDFSLQLSSGMLEQVDDDLDTTSLLSFLQQAGTLAAKAAGAAVAEGSVEGDIGLDPGFYFWDGSGPMVKIGAAAE